MAEADDELRQRLEPIFAKFDHDGSGSISTHEMGSVLKEMGFEISEDAIAQMMRDADKDQSGEVDMTEFVDAFKKQRAGGGGAFVDVLSQAFGIFDPRRWFQEDDLGSEPWECKDEAVRIFRLADTDGDGYLNEQGVLSSPTRYMHMYNTHARRVASQTLLRHGK